MSVVLIACLILVSVCLVGYSLFSSRFERQDRIKQRMKADTNKVGPHALKAQQQSTAKKWFKEKAAPVLAKPVKPKTDSDQSRLRIKLANAGFRRESAPVIFLASKTAVGVLGLVATLGTTAGLGYPAQTVFGIACLAAGAGFMLPDVWLYLAAKSRGQKLSYSLPDCLDLMVICVESGLGLDASLQRVSQEMSHVHPELAEEFSLANMEVQMGITRDEALTNLAVRTGVASLKSLSTMLIQAERFGTSIASALRVHADVLRTKRQQAAEEMAAKTAVKLLLPLIFFIFPAMFVALAGPAALNLWRTMGSGALSK